jgi:ankyrin repeat protein
LVRQPGVDLEALSTIQRTPLHLAAIKGYMDCVRLLVDKGANPNCRDFDECTPLHCAAEFGCINIIIFLIKESAADASLKNKFGLQPSDIAQNNEVRMVFDSLLNKNKHQ